MQTRVVSTVCRTIVDKSQTVFRTCKCTLETICIDDRFVRCSRDARRRCASLDRFSFFIACSRVRIISRLRDTDNKLDTIETKTLSSLLENEEIESDQNYSNVCAFRLFLLFIKIILRLYIEMKRR